jgi:anti-sigma factor RsiW
MKCEDGLELITGLVDDELSQEELSLIKSHLADCQKCDRIYVFERALKSELREAAMTVRAPSTLRRKILRDQRRSPGRSWLSERWLKLPRFASFVVQTAAIVALFGLSLISARYWLQSTQFPIAGGIFQSYRQIAQGEISPVETENMTELKEHLLRSVGGKFAPMAYDFSAMDLKLVGGLLQEIANRPVLVTIYKGNGSTLICYTFLGSEDDAPAVAEILFDRGKGMNFYQFSHAGINAVMHREGQVMCILVSQMPMNELLALARSKAHPS